MVYSAIKQISSAISGNFTFKQNYPNPFNPETKIEFNLKENGNYKLEMFDVSGKKIEEIFNERFLAGTYQIIFRANNLTSGVYIYKLSSKQYSESKKFLLIK